MTGHTRSDGFIDYTKLQNNRYMGMKLTTQYTSQS